MKTIRRLRYSIYAGILIMLLVTISVATVMFVSSSGQDKLIKKVDRIAPQLMEQYKVPGAAMALVGDGEVVWSSGYGLADKDLGVPVIGDTVFQVALDLESRHLLGCDEAGGKRPPGVGCACRAIPDPLASAPFRF